jgi:hypothetical protein
MTDDSNVSDAGVAAERLKLENAAAEKVGRKIGEGFVDAAMGGIGDEQGGLTKYFKDLANDLLSPKAYLNRAMDLETQATKLRNTLGLGVEKSREFSQAIADNAGKFKEYGFDLEDVVDTYDDLFKTFKTNVSVSNEELLELKTTAAVTGVQVDNLAGSFRGVGISITEVGDNMLEVVNIAKDAGVAVSSVSKEVVGNLDKMNLYNFEGGVKGLAKMSAQAVRLNIDMSKMFSIVENAMDPEKAINYAASLQRLGALLDPLRMMDMAQNDPAELQNQIVNMTKDFVRFNKELGQFEIMPGEKRRLKEIGDELGMASGELQKMALNAANLDFKMKQIRFPSSIASKEDRELIATLATVNKQGVAEVKVKKVDAQGKPTGEFDMVAVENLTDAQIQGLKEQQSQGQTMEEIAKEQLTEQQRLNYLIESVFTSIGYGVAGSKPVRGVMELVTKDVRQNLFQETGRKEGEPKGLIGEEFRNSEIYRKFTNTGYETAKTYVTELMKQMGLPTDMKDIKELVLNKVSDLIPDMSSIEDYLPDISSITDLFKNVIPMGGSETDPLSNFQTITKSLNTITENTNTQINQISNFSSMEFKPLEIKEDMKVSLDVKLDPDSKNQALTQLMTTALEMFFQGGGNKDNVNMVLEELNKLKTNQGLTLNQTKESLVNMPGKKE